MREITRDEQKIHTHVKNMMNKIINNKIQVPKWKYEFRASSIPFCQWYVALAKIFEDHPELLPPTTTGFLFDYYVSIGSTTHSVFQRWLGRFGYLYGDYKCETCKKIVKGHLGWPESCPTKSCPGKSWEYIELTLHGHVAHIGLKSAHCDGLLHFPGMPPNKYYLTDFKTCSLKTLPNPQTRFTDPNHIKYLTQTGFYHYILTKYMNLDILGTVFLMVARDDPTKTTPIIYNQSLMAERMFNAVVAEYEAAELTAKTGDFSGIVKSCQTPHDKDDCPFVEWCFNKRVMEEELLPVLQKHFGRLPILE